MTEKIPVGASPIVLFCPDMTAAIDIGELVSDNFSNLDPIGFTDCLALAVVSMLEPYGLLPTTTGPSHEPIPFPGNVDGTSISDLFIRLRPYFLSLPSMIPLCIHTLRETISMIHGSTPFILDGDRGPFLQSLIDQAADPSTITFISVELPGQPGTLAEAKHLLADLPYRHIHLTEPDAPSAASRIMAMLDPSL